MFLWMHSLTAFERPQTMREARLSTHSVTVLRVAMIHGERLWDHLKGFREYLARQAAENHFVVTQMLDRSNILASGFSNQRHSAVQRSVARIYGETNGDQHKNRNPTTTNKIYLCFNTNIKWYEISCQLYHEPFQYRNPQDGHPVDKNTSLICCDLWAVWAFGNSIICT